MKNYRGFREKNFSFDPHFTAIIGKNATGKTTIIEALSIAAGTYLMGIDEAQPKRKIQEYEVYLHDFGQNLAVIQNLHKL